MPVAQKHRAISHQEKMAFSTPGRVVLGLTSPSRRVCADVRTDGRSRDYYVRTKISRIDRLPGGVMNLSIAPIGIVRRMIRAIVTSQAGQVSKLKWLSNNHIARSLSRVIIQRI